MTDYRAVNAQLVAVLREVRTLLNDERVVEFMFGMGHDISLAASCEATSRLIDAALANATQEGRGRAV